ncbi:MAG: RluA family pseudouridine synthase, partial [Chitinispirillaceae bacterium]|nr:RluA family pseudouridine synthase [Chitinispirillaceae bacterium]
MEEIIVEGSDAGIRLDVFLTRKVEGFSRAKIQQLLEDGLILLNGKPSVKKYLVEKGDRITLNFSKESILYRSKPLPENIKIEIIYEDENLIAVNKPAGLVVHPGKGNYCGTLVNALVSQVNRLSDVYGEERAGIVHRLDKETSGVLLIAKDNKTHFKLASDFANRRIEKEYIGICIGSVS